MILEREEGGERRERERERKASVLERNTDLLPPICTPTGDGTCNLLVHRRTLQPTGLLARAIEAPFYR